jgi:hypothetical protein
VEQVRHQAQVLPRREERVDGRELAGHPDRGADALAVRGQVVARDRYGAGVRRQLGAHDPDGGRLARAVRPQQGEHGAGGHLQVDPVEDDLVPERLAEPARGDG